MRRIGADGAALRNKKGAGLETMRLSKALPASICFNPAGAYELLHDDTSSVYASITPWAILTGMVRYHAQAGLPLRSTHLRQKPQNAASASRGASMPSSMRSAIHPRHFCSR